MRRDPGPFPPSGRLDVGRLVARVLCVLFALIGLLPLSGGALARTEPVRKWAANETARVLRDVLGVQARYGVELSFWPLELALEDVRVEASDGGSPAFEAARIAVIPRIFSLLAGRLDVGDIEVDAPRGRIVIRDGELTNVAYRLPESQGQGPELERAPFSSMAITDARLDLEIDDAHVRSGPMDLDVFADGDAFEVALRMGETDVTLHRSVETEPADDATQEPGGDEDDSEDRASASAAVDEDDSEDRASASAVDEDVLCQLDARVRVEPDGGLVRRLSLIGALDDDPAAGTRPACSGSEGDPRRVATRLSQVRVRLDDDYAPVLIDGHVVVKAPGAVSGRFGVGPFGGWVAASGDVHYTKKHELPDFRGSVQGADLTLSPYTLTEKFDGQVEITSNVIVLPEMTAQYGHGTAKITGARLEPFADGFPLHIERVEGSGVQWEDFMENNDVTRDTIVQWNIDRTEVGNFGGTLDPVELDGDLFADTSGFEVFDRAYHDKDRQHIVGVKSATVRGKFGVRANAVQFMNVHAGFGKSKVRASVSVGFDNTIWLDVAKESSVELSDISPLIDIPMSGRASFGVNMAGLAKEAELRGEMSVKDLVFAGFPFGDVEQSKISFRPLKLDFSDVRGKKGESVFKVPSARLDFDTGATLLADAVVESDRMTFKDFFHMWHFDEDPRFADIAGTAAVSARVHYDMGGKKDPCGTGYLRVDGSVESDGVDLMEEHYDRASGSFDFRWFDSDAGHLGMQIEVPDLLLGKGSGTLLGNVKVTEGGVIDSHVTATGLPLSKIQAMGELGRRLEARVSAVADVSGTIDAMKAKVKVDMTPTRVGRRTLPASHMSIDLVPKTTPLNVIGETKCGRPKLAPFDPAQYDKDRPSGVFHLDGELFGGQIALDDVTVTRQRKKHVAGAVKLDRLDLGALSELSPELALSGNRPNGQVTAGIQIDELDLERPGLADASVRLEDLSFGQDGVAIVLQKPAAVLVQGGRADLPGMVLAATVPGGHRGTFDVSGSVDKLGRVPVVDASLVLRETDLSSFRSLVPRADRMTGTLGGRFRVTGPVTDLVHEGRLELKNGNLVLRGAPVAVEDLSIVARLTPDELVLDRAGATVGGGTVLIRGRAPLNDWEIGPARAVITASGVDVPVSQGVHTALDADLEATYRPSEGDERNLPRLAGTVSLRSFSYTRKVTMTADITSLGKRGKKTKFEAYDPALDAVELDITIQSAEALRIENDLIDARLVIEPPGLQLSGTNQRFGVRGKIATVKGGTIRLRRSEFEITHGYIRFDDAERIAPKVDVTATTEYTRYADASTAAGDASVGGASSSGGRWRITMRAHGDAENLRVDLSSEPELGQDDIFLLLTLGLTRAELDQAQSASAGQSVALEALGRLTGADRAVTENIPVIDEFRFGSAYSSRTGRTEPTVTIGKRLTRRIRAYVTSGLTESRELRSNLEWRLNPKVSVESSYDNVNDISSSTLGNLGADIRWRMEFE